MGTTRPNPRRGTSNQGKEQAHWDDWGDIVSACDFVLRLFHVGAFSLFDFLFVSTCLSKRNSFFLETLTRIEFLCVFLKVVKEVES
mmetsp:Transcript_41940/g.42528  ORF Transcript_41940/g.42528 Transcript_41940/m.42528 type:complete len:86 (+) Transcript_41940:412-669(+)